MVMNEGSEFQTDGAEHQKAPCFKSVMCGQCDARHTVTFLAVEYHRSSTSTTLSCLATKAHVRMWLIQNRTWQRNGRALNPWPPHHGSNIL